MKIIVDRIQYSIFVRNIWALPNSRLTGYYTFERKFELHKTFGSFPKYIWLKPLVIQKHDQIGRENKGIF